ncbi:MAG: ribosomal protein S18-alanine N-acetyltransferase [Pyrinomonadaceae bacterium]
MSRAKSVASLDELEFVIAPMTEHDLVEVVEIEETCGLSRWGWDAYHAELVENSSAIMFVARSLEESFSGERILGYVASRNTADELHINNIAVRPAFRRCGIGISLLNAVLREGARRGARSSLLEVRAGNKAAQELYARLGFQLTGRRRNYYNTPKEDALIMVASLGFNALSQEEF